MHSVPETTILYKASVLLELLFVTSIPNVKVIQSKSLAPSLREAFQGLYWTQALIFTTIFSGPFVQERIHTCLTRVRFDAHGQHASWSEKGSSCETVGHCHVARCPK